MLKNAFNYAYTEFVRKPINRHELTGLVQQALERHYGWLTTDRSDES